MWAPEETSRRAGPELYKIDHDYKVPEPTKFKRNSHWMERENVIDQYPEIAEKLELRLCRFLRRYAPEAAKDSLDLNA